MGESSGLCGLCDPCGSISRSGLERNATCDGRSDFQPQRAHGTQREEISMTGFLRQSDRNAERFWSLCSLRSLRLKFQDGLERHVSREPPSDLQRPRAIKRPRRHVDRMDAPCFLRDLGVCGGSILKVDLSETSHSRDHEDLGHKEQRSTKKWNAREISRR